VLTNSVTNTSGPRASVIIPVYNGARYLREAIDSVLGQTYPNLELVVIDDGSTDDTWSIVESYGSRLRGLRQSNGGVANALNHGIEVATGEYIAWLSHDDAFLPQKLAIQMDCLTQNRSAQICYSDYWVVDEHSQRLGVLNMPAYPPDRFVRHLLQAMFVCGSTTLVHRACFQSVGPFDETLRHAQDADMWLRLARRYGFVHVDQPLIHWRYHPDQGSRNETQRQRDRHTYLKRCLEEFTLQDFFPELPLAIDKQRMAARAREYLGHVMLRRHREATLALRQYALGVRAWPSARNPTLWYGLGLGLGGWVYYWLGRKVARQARAAQPAQKMPRVDYIAASSVVDLSLA
jgi:glycosyltransferase involved in cell wall biosynthesis